MAAVNSWFTGIKIDTNVRGADPLDRHLFFNNTQRDLIKISGYNLGADLLNLIRKRHEGVGTSGSGNDRVVIIKMRPHTRSEGASTLAVQAGDRLSSNKQFGGRSMAFAGKGSKTYVAMHNGPDSEAIYTRLCGKRTPTWIVLAHELIHALHHLSGTTYRDSVRGEGGEAKREEMATTGLGAYKNGRLTENAIRREAGLPERTFYTFPNDHQLIPSLGHAGEHLGYWICSALQ